MIVAQILASKGRDVATTTPDRSISDVVAELATRKIGALVVTERGRVVGIVSERDIVKTIGLKGPEILADPVSSIMTRDVVTCGEGDTINGVMTRMTRRPLPPPAGGRGRRPGRHRLDRRRGEGADRGSRVRGRRTQDLYRDGLSRPVRRRSRGPRRSRRSSSALPRSRCRWPRRRGGNRSCRSCRASVRW